MPLSCVCARVFLPQTRLEGAPSRVPLSLGRSDPPSLLPLPSPPLPLLCLLPTPPSPRVLNRRPGAPEPSPGRLTSPLPQRRRQLWGKTLLRAGLSPLSRAAGRRRWGIGPGGHPMGGVSAARPSWNSAGKAAVPRASALRFACCLSVKAARLGRSPEPSTCPARGAERVGWRAGHFSSPRGHTGLNSSS